MEKRDFSQVLQEMGFQFRQKGLWAGSRQVLQFAVLCAVTCTADVREPPPGTRGAFTVPKTGSSVVLHVGNVSFLVPSATGG